MGQSTSQQACRNCGNLNRVDSVFCSRCGSPLNDTLTGTVASNQNAPTVASVVGRRITGALTLGMLIGARYNVVRLLGRGGFGAVYLATDNRFPARRVAVKEMGDAQLAPKDRALAIANFKQEADLLSRLQHGNMPAVSDFIEEGGKAYLVMDFIDGSTLEDVRRAAGGGPLDEALVMGWTLQICDVLDYLHNQPQPIIFRDLKPDNIMVTPANQIKLIDFGIARIFKSSATRDTNSLGSQGYAAPEQYGIEQTDARTDIYALGATLYDLLTGQVPLLSLVRKTHPQSFVPPRQLNPRLSPGVEQVILTAMAIEKSERYQSATEMARAVRQLGFAVTRNTSAMHGLSGPDAVTVASMQQGSPVTSATLNPHPPRAGAPSSQSGQTVVAQTQLQAPANPYSSPSPYALSTPPSAGAGYPSGGISGSIAPPPPPGGGLLENAGTSTPPPDSGNRVSRRALLIGGGAAVVAAAAGIYYLSHRGATTSSGPGGNAVTLTFSYSTEKAPWLGPAITAFNQSNTKLAGSSKSIYIQPGGDLGSVDGQSQILSGQLQPIAWSPASNLEINRLNYKWQQTHKGTPIISYSEQYQPRSLVKSPLVLAAWQERAHALPTGTPSIPPSRSKTGARSVAGLAGDPSSSVRRYPISPTAVC